MNMKIEAIARTFGATKGRAPAPGVAANYYKTGFVAPA
jgi:hypothetical protein